MNSIYQFFPQRNMILTLKIQVNRRTNYIWCWRHCFILLLTAGNDWEFNSKQSHLLENIVRGKLLPNPIKPIFLTIDMAAIKLMKASETPTCTHYDLPSAPIANYASLLELKQPQPLIWSKSYQSLSPYNNFPSLSKDSKPRTMLS